ncbi:MAG: hypothetical protein LBI18_04885 [Planctomycetaceae bacterium]|nr:hypothetical protein [Planctomycetaceae bacterium]
MFNGWRLGRVKNCQHSVPKPVCQHNKIKRCLPAFQAKTLGVPRELWGIPQDRWGVPQELWGVPRIQC